MQSLQIAPQLDMLSLQVTEEAMQDAMTSVLPPELCGWLLHRKGRLRRWKAEYFVLLGSTLLYAPSQDPNARIRCAWVDGCHIETMHAQTGRAFSFCLRHGERGDFLLCAESEEERTLWMESLAVASQWRETQVQLATELVNLRMTGVTETAGAVAGAVASSGKNGKCPKCKVAQAANRDLQERVHALDSRCEDLTKASRKSESKVRASEARAIAAEARANEAEARALSMEARVKAAEARADKADRELEIAVAAPGLSPAPAPELAPAPIGNHSSAKREEELLSEISSLEGALRHDAVMMKRLENQIKAERKARAQAIALFSDLRASSLGHQHSYDSVTMSVGMGLDQRALKALLGPSTHTRTSPQRTRPQVSSRAQVSDEGFTESDDEDEDFGDVSFPGSARAARVSPG